MLYMMERTPISDTVGGDVACQQIVRETKWGYRNEETIEIKSNGRDISRARKN